MHVRISYAPEYSHIHTHSTDKPFFISTSNLNISVSDFPVRIHTCARARVDVVAPSFECSGPGPPLQLSKPASTAIACWQRILLSNQIYVKPGTNCNLQSNSDSFSDLNFSCFFCCLEEFLFFSVLSLSLSFFFDHHNFSSRIHFRHTQSLNFKSFRKTNEFLRFRPHICVHTTCEKAAADYL